MHLLSGANSKQKRLNLKVNTMEMTGQALTSQDGKGCFLTIFEVPSVSLPKRKKMGMEGGAGERWFQRVRDIAAVPEDPGSVPSIHIGWFTTAYNSSSKGTHASGPLRAPALMWTPPRHRHTHHSHN